MRQASAADTIRAAAQNAAAEELPGVAAALAEALSSVLSRSAAVPRPVVTPETAAGLLDVDEAARRLNVAPSWLYRHARKLPFTKKLGHKTLRFDARGLERWAQTRAGG